MSNNIKKFPNTKKRSNQAGKVFLVKETKCFHGEYIVDERLDHVECGKCGEHLNPMYVLKRIAMEESREHEALYNINIALEDAAKKTKWKCGHCGKFSDIRLPARIRGA